MPPKKRATPATFQPEGEGSNKRTPSGVFDALRGKAITFVPEKILGIAQRTKAGGAVHPVLGV